MLQSMGSQRVRQDRATEQHRRHPTSLSCERGFVLQVGGEQMEPLQLWPQPRSCPGLGKSRELQKPPSLYSDTVPGPCYSCERRKAEDRQQVVEGAWPHPSRLPALFLLMMLLLPSFLFCFSFSCAPGHVQETS